MELKIFANSLLGILLIVENFQSGQSDLMEKALELKRLRERLSETKTLNHGDLCNHSDELETANVEEESIELLSGSKEEKIDRIIDRIKGLINNGRSLCNSKRLLGCDENSGRCGCGPVTAGHSYILEKGQCHWALGSVCSITELRDGPVPGITAKCQDNSQCVIERNGKECRIRNMGLDRLSEFPCVCKAWSTTGNKESTPESHKNEAHSPGHEGKYNSIIHLFILVIFCYFQ